MQLRKLLNQHSGFTLVEFMTAIGLTGLVVFLIGDFVKKQGQNESSIKARSDVLRAVGTIEGATRNNIVCKSIFTGIVPTTSGVNIPTLTYTTAGVTKTIIEQNKDYGTFRIGNPASPTSNNILLKQSGISPTIVDLVVKFTLKGSNQLVERKIPLIVSLSAGGAVVDCGPLLADSNTAAKKQFCESLPGVATWNDGPGTCTLNSNLKCPAGQVVESMTSLGGLVCVNALNRIDPNMLFDTTPQNCVGRPNITLQSVGGKIKAVCN